MHHGKNFLLIAALLTVSAVASTAEPAEDPLPTLTTNFEAGSIGKIVWVSGKHLRCAVLGEVDQDQRNRQPSWFYFRLDGVS
jgi:hypothetical protein